MFTKYAFQTLVYKYFYCLSYLLKVCNVPSNYKCEQTKSRTIKLHLKMYFIMYISCM